MNPFETLLFEKTDGIAHVTLNRPDVLNVHNMQMRDDMVEVFGAIRQDEEIRAVVLRGAGERAFCAGADLSEFLTAPSPTAARQVRFDRDLWNLLLNVPQPMIAAVHGYVLGSGIEMALCCDLRVAAEDSRFGLPEVGLGIIPAAGGTQTLPRAVGSARALEMLLTNRWLDAREALRIGMVNRVVERDVLWHEADEMALCIATKDPLAMRLAKLSVAKGMDLSMPLALELERRLSCRIAMDQKSHREESRK